MYIHIMIIIIIITMFIDFFPSSHQSILIAHQYINCNTQLCAHFLAWQEKVSTRKLAAFTT